MFSVGKHDARYHESRTHRGALANVFGTVHEGLSFDRYILR